MRQKSSSMAVIWSVAFVWFTTQFGGGFASGRQLIDYFIQYGWYAVFTPILAQLALAILLTYVLKVSYLNKAGNYNQFTTLLYGKLSPVMNPAFEIIYNITMIIATAVAFATGGATINQLLGVPYWISTLAVGACIFLLTIFGASLVRKAATAMSVFIVVGMLAVYLPNIIVALPDMAEKFAYLSAHTKPMGSAMWKTLLYVGFQVVALGAYVAHSRAFTHKNDARNSMIAGFVVNTAMIMLTVVGMIAVIDVDGILKQSVPVPVLVLVQNGVGSSVLVPIISLLIIVGSISTGVNFVYGVVDRIAGSISNISGDEKVSINRKKHILVSAFYTVLCFAVAQFGLIPLVNKGYAYCGWAAIFIIIIPIIYKWVRFGTEGSKEA